MLNTDSELMLILILGDHKKHCGRPVRVRAYGGQGIKRVLAEFWLTVSSKNLSFPLWSRCYLTHQVIKKNVHSSLDYQIEVVDTWWCLKTQKVTWWSCPNAYVFSPVTIEACIQPHGLYPLIGWLRKRRLEPGLLMVPHVMQVPPTSG